MNYYYLIQNVLTCDRDILFVFTLITHIKRVIFIIKSNVNFLLKCSFYNVLKVSCIFSFLATDLYLRHNSINSSIIMLLFIINLSYHYHRKQRTVKNHLN